MSEARRPGRRRAHVVVWSLLALGLVAIAALGIAGYRLVDGTMTVKAHLEDARTQLGAFQLAASEQRFTELPNLASAIRSSTEAAVAPTTDGLWRLGEQVPWVGANLRAVRTIAESGESVSREIVSPAAGLLGGFALRRDPATGGFDLASLREASDLAATAATVLDEVSERVDAIDGDALVPQVRDAVEQLAPVLDEARAAVPPLRAGLAGVGRLLGVDGPQTVALVFLNNAETAGLGGGPAAQTILRVEDGRVSPVAQLSSSDFPRGIPLDVTVDESANVLYDDILTQHINGASSRPDFPTTAKILTAQLQRTAGITPDTIVSIDPIALSKMLAVTGPVALPDGTALTAENVVGELLNQAYFRYPEGSQSDAYFAAAASAIFDRVVSADYDLWAMADALTAAANDGDLMLWSADPETQALLDGLRIQGTLPSSNEPETVLGVYFRDRSSSKIDYYLHTDTTVTTDACVPDAPSYTVETHLRFEIPEGLELPAYVDSGLYDYYRTEVFLYGPVGASITSTETPQIGVESVVGPGATDLGRPAQKFVVDLLNGQDAVVKATFAGTPESGPYGPTVVRTTPMINATSVTMQDAGCG